MIGFRSVRTGRVSSRPPHVSRARALARLGVWVVLAGMLGACGDAVAPTAAPARRFDVAIAAAPGKIFVNHDEWTLSAAGYGNAPEADELARNVASWFTGGAAGNFL